MGTRDHYVSQFHLQGFTDPTATQPNEPWLWVGDCTSGSVARRAPKNFAWTRNLFSGPGGLGDRAASIERYLATQVESPAAAALRDFLSRPVGQMSAVPPEVGRYLAWAAARSLPMKRLCQAWIDDLPVPADTMYAEPPPSGFEQIAPVTRAHRLEHPTLGVRDDVSSDEVDALRRQGWRLLLSADDFLELVHLQAWYFQARFFPRLRWIILDAPAGWSFIIGDRPVVWGFGGVFDAQPNALRHPDVQVLAPLTSSVALFAFHASSMPPGTVHVNDVNRAMAGAATQWIAGPTRHAVLRGLKARTPS